MKEFSNKRVVITGGSSGIGRALAHMLTEAGADVAIVARRPELLEQTLEEMEQRRVSEQQKLLSFPVDIAQQQQVETLAKDVLEAFSSIDVLLNNAGIAHCDFFENTSPETFQKMMDVNFFGTVWMTRAFLPTMKAQNSGHIVNVTSIVGVLSIVGYTAYAASKFAIMGFTDALRNELAATNIRFSLVLPPDTDTPQYAQENQTKPEVTRVVAGKASLMQPEAVAELTLRGMLAKRYHIVPGKMDLKLPYYASYLAPGLVRFVVDREVRNFEKKALDRPPN
ncbi:MAG: SDR family oxidoreductase [Myxococcota bacterium]